VIPEQLAWWPFRNIKLKYDSFLIFLERREAEEKLGAHVIKFVEVVQVYAISEVVHAWHCLLKLSLTILR
jgi:hypothetical protein